MGVKESLVGVTVSAILLTAGFYSYHEGVQQRRTAELEANCAIPKNAGKFACKNTVTSTESLTTDSDIANIYMLVGALGVVSGGIVAIGSIEMLGEDPEATDEDPDGTENHEGHEAAPLTAV